MQHLNQATVFGYASKDPDASPLQNHYVYDKRSDGPPKPLGTVS